MLGVAPQHRLARQKISAKELKNEDFILFKQGSGLRQTVLYMTEQAGFVPHVIFESGDIGSIRALVAEGVGISVFPQSVIESSEKSIVPLPVQPALPHRTILLAWQQRRAASLGIQEFLAFLQEDIAAYPWQQVLGKKQGST
jgi:DNA-binding transcriptional LysR family regulator